MVAVWAGAACGLILGAGWAAADPAVNELVARPAGGEGEWLELAQSGGAVVDLEGWSIRDATGRARGLPPGTRLGPGGFLLLAARPESLRAYYALPESIPVTSPESWPILNDHDAGTGLPADVVVLVDATGVVRDSVAYFESWLPTAAGRSLERAGPGAPAQHASSWGWSLDPRGASPGRENSLTRQSPESGGLWSGPSHVELGQGSAPFRYRLPAPGRMAIWLLDSEGREVAMLQAPMEVPPIGEWIWGPGVPGPARPGVYFLCLRWHGESARVRRCTPVWVQP